MSVSNVSRHDPAQRVADKDQADRNVGRHRDERGAPARRRLALGDHDGEPLEPRADPAEPVQGASVEQMRRARTRDRGNRVGVAAQPNPEACAAQCRRNRSPRVSRTAGVGLDLVVLGATAVAVGTYPRDSRASRYASSGSSSP